jgi:hypothetical protein
MHRPNFSVAWSLFQQVNVPVKEVGKKIGGKVGENIASGAFENACPIQLSYVLNYAGVRIPGEGYNVVSGADGKWYMFRVHEMKGFLMRMFGKPDKALAPSPQPADFFGLKGIIVVAGHGWGNARGHVTLWNGALGVCSDSCHLFTDPDNGHFVPESASLWSLL